MTAPPASRREQHDAGIPDLASLPRLPRAYPGTEVVALPRLPSQKDSANKQKGASEVTAEEWLPIPDSFYEISNRRRVRSVDHVVVRRNGYRCCVRGRLRRISVDRRSGLQYVTLALGRRGRCRTAYIHRLMEEVFGDGSE
jgi:hypothetical protein